MTDIASSLEQEFADKSQAERDAYIAHLRQLEAAGRGSLDVKSHAIVLPVVFVLLGALVLFGAISSDSMTSKNAIIVGLIGVLLIVPSLWAAFGPRKPRFTLTEQGVQVKDVLLPWSSIEDYGVLVHSINGFTTNTTITFHHAEGFTPPKLGLFYMFGGTPRDRKSGLYQTRLILHVGAKGMNGDKLARRIGEFLSAARARAELTRLQAN